MHFKKSEEEHILQVQGLYSLLSLISYGCAFLEPEHFPTAKALSVETAENSRQYFGCSSRVWWIHNTNQIFLQWLILLGFLIVVFSVVFFWGGGNF